MWEINNYLQILSFLRAVAFGMIICVAYDILRGVRISSNRSITAVLIEDLIFWILSAFFVFCFLLAVTNGEIRLYIFIGMLLGFCIFRATVSKLLLKMYVVFFKFIFRIYRFLKQGLNNIFLFLEHLLEKIMNFCSEFFKKGKKGQKNS